MERQARFGYARVVEASTPHPSDVGSPAPRPSAQLTVLLERARLGDSAAAAEVLPLVYDELRHIARAKLGGRSPGESLEATALVHEAYLRLFDRATPFESRRHFYCTAARAMRSVLVDHVRARRSAKRGGEAKREPLHAAIAWYEARSIDLVALDEALESLEAVDPVKRTLVELRFFAGLDVAQAAELLGVSRATAEREWAVTRAWLRGRLAPGAIAQ